MNNNLSLIIPTLAGLSTIIGFLPIYLPENNQNNIIPLSISFSASVMILISLFSLIPESFYYLKTIDFKNIIIVLIAINIGIIISNITNKKVGNNNYSNLYKLGIISLLAIILHNIPEGIITYLTTNNNLKLGITLSIGIALHNIPEGIAIAIPIYYSTNSKLKAFIYTLISGFSELLGAIFAHLFLKRITNNLFLSMILGITAGIMINLSLTELIPESLTYNKKKTTLLGILLGIIIIIITKLLN